MTKKEGEERIETINEMTARWLNFFEEGKLYTYRQPAIKSRGWNDPLIFLGIDSINHSTYSIRVSFINKNGQKITGYQYIDNNPKDKWKKL